MQKEMSVPVPEPNLVLQALELISYEKLFDPISWFAYKRLLNPDLTCFWLYGEDETFNVEIRK